jgi:hypothetical protein
MLMRCAIVAQSDADDAGFVVFGYPNHRIALPCFQVFPGRQDVIRGAVDVLLEVIKFIFDAKSFWQSANDGVIRLVDGHFELAIVVVPARAAADEVLVVLGPVSPIIPERWVHQEQTFAGFCEVNDRGTSGGICERLVIAKVENINTTELFGNRAWLVGVGGLKEGSVQNRKVCVAEPFVEIVRAAAANDQHLHRTGFSVRGSGGSLHPKSGGKANEKNPQNRLFHTLCSKASGFGAKRQPNE